MGIGELIGSCFAMKRWKPHFCSDFRPQGVVGSYNLQLQNANKNFLCISSYLYTYSGYLGVRYRGIRLFQKIDFKRLID